MRCFFLNLSAKILSPWTPFFTKQIKMTQKIHNLSKFNSSSYPFRSALLSSETTLLQFQMINIFVRLSKKYCKPSIAKVQITVPLLQPFQHHFLASFWLKLMFSRRCPHCPASLFLKHVGYQSMLAPRFPVCLLPPRCDFRPLRPLQFPFSNAASRSCSRRLPTPLLSGSASQAKTIPVTI